MHAYIHVLTHMHNLIWLPHIQQQDILFTTISQGLVRNYHGMGIVLCFYMNLRNCQ